MWFMLCIFRNRKFRIIILLKTKKSILLSEQMIVDCDDVDAGCNGGLMDTVFNWIKDNGGKEPAENYPYTGVEGTCYSDMFQI